MDVDTRALAMDGDTRAARRGEREEEEEEMMKNLSPKEEVMNRFKSVNLSLSLSKLSLKETKTLCIIHKPTTEIDEKENLLPCEPEETLRGATFSSIPFTGLNAQILPPAKDSFTGLNLEQREIQRGQEDIIKFEGQTSEVTLTPPATEDNSPRLAYPQEKQPSLIADFTPHQWIWNFVEPLSSEPSQQLRALLLSSSCDHILEDIAHMARILLESVFSISARRDKLPTRRFHSRPTGTAIGCEDQWGQRNRILAMKVYYLFLEPIITSTTTTTTTTTSLLITNETFQRGMLACSAELILAAYTTRCTSTVKFPALLNHIGITPFDFFKVLNIFIRHDKSLLTNQLRWHLRTLRNRLLEFMLWEKGSSFYNSLIVARPDLSATINHLGLLADPMPSLDAMLAILPSLHEPPHTPATKLGGNSSPAHNADGVQSSQVWGRYLCLPPYSRMLPFNGFRSKSPHLPLQSAFANPGGEGTSAKTVISAIFRKVLELAAYKISWLVECLSMTQCFEESVNWFVKEVVVHRTSLLFNRHIDHIILCSLYGVAKIMQLNLTFKKIVNQYTRRPQQSNPQVISSVFVDWSQTHDSEKKGQDHVSINTFYNEVFVPAVKPIMFRLKMSKTNTF